MPALENCVMNNSSLYYSSSILNAYFGDRSDSQLSLAIAVPRVVLTAPEEAKDGGVLCDRAEVVEENGKGGLLSGESGYLKEKGEYLNEEGRDFSKERLFLHEKGKISTEKRPYSHEKQQTTQNQCIQGSPYTELDLEQSQVHEFDSTSVSTAFTVSGITNSPKTNDMVGVAENHGAHKKERYPIKSHATSPMTELPPRSSLFSSIHNPDQSEQMTDTTNVSLYSSLSYDSDLDLESVKLPLDELSLEKPKQSRLKRLQHFLTRDNVPQKPLTDNDKFEAYVDNLLRTTCYACDERPVLNIDFVAAAEIFFFGDTLPSLFPKQQSMVHYLMQSSLELGEAKFSNLNRFHTDASYDIRLILEDLLPKMATFNDILDLYALSSDNINRSELFETFSQFANESKGLCIPLAISMFGNWLLSFNRDNAVKSNYENDLILDYFRKLIRLALVIRRLQPLLEKVSLLFTKKESMDLSRYWKKDNVNALATSLLSLGEYYQFIHEHDKAVTIWEINCHLTEDTESGNLAILGLSNGYGFGNLSKKQKVFGHHSKIHKFNTKRRTAHIYRILMRKPDFDEFGVLWATKEKYD